MFCPYCSHENTKVLESRILADAMRRRRECLSCSNRFTTYERAMFNFTVSKKDGREEPFNVEKIKNSLSRACSKIDADNLLTLTKKVEQKVLLKKANPIKTTEIGRIVLRELKKFDKIAYLRFASIHKDIEDPKLLEKELQTIV